MIVRCEFVHSQFLLAFLGWRWVGPDSLAETIGEERRKALSVYLSFDRVRLLEKGPDQGKISFLGNRLSE